MKFSVELGHRLSSANCNYCHNGYNYNYYRKPLKQSNAKMEQKKMGRKVRTFQDYYDACERAGWLLPTISSGIVTRQYLDAIRKGHYYCPHFDHDIKQLRCPNPPPKMVLLKIWKKAVYQKAKAEP